MFTVATYNILHGYHQDLILSNLKTLITKGVDIICLQEAEILFEPAIEGMLKQMGGNWKIHYFHGDIGAHLAFLWNNDVVQLEKSESLLLPTIKPVLIQRIKNHAAVIQRAAFIGSFLIGKKKIQVTNVHLAWEGGIKHRLNQLGFLRNTLEKSDNCDGDIIAGDFNTFAPAYFRLKQQSQIEKVLPEYTNVFPDLVWTCDISSTAPQDKWETIAKICRFFNIKLQSKLDYIFARKLEVISSEMLDLPGSDHRPLIAKFK